MTSSWFLIHTVIHVDHTLTIAETTKFLGMIWTVTFQSHINVLLKKLSALCSIMRKLSYMLNIVTLTTVHFAYLKLWYNILGLINNHVEYIFDTDRNNKNHAGSRS